MNEKMTHIGSEAIGFFFSVHGGQRLLRTVSLRCPLPLPRFFEFVKNRLNINHKLLLLFFKFNIIQTRRRSNNVVGI